MCQRKLRVKPSTSINSSTLYVRKKRLKIENVEILRKSGNGRSVHKVREKDLVEVAAQSTYLTLSENSRKQCPDSSNILFEGFFYDFDFKPLVVIFDLDAKDNLSANVSSVLVILPYIARCYLNINYAN